MTSREETHAENDPHTDYRPPGYSTLTPFLCVAGAAKAITFYREVFGATLVSSMDAPDGTVAHAELQLEQGRLQLSDPMEGYGLAPHDGTAPATHSLAIYVPDCDATVAAAEKAGATVREQPSTFVTGDRFGSILDPFGVRWSVMTRVENVSDAEAEKRVKEWMASQG
ncbi:MAG: VOC family protein [Actinomycetota bacterium]|nr:VOC family protein [Actinomycetota bacterium]